MIVVVYLHQHPAHPADHYTQITPGVIEWHCGVSMMGDGVARIGGRLGISASIDVTISKEVSRIVTVTAEITTTKQRTATLVMSKFNTDTTGAISYVTVTGGEGTRWITNWVTISLFQGLASICE